MLLPDAALSPDPCRVLVAALPSDQSHDPGAQDAPLQTYRVIGAVAATLHHVQVPLRGPRMVVHVVPSLRRQGIASALLDTLASNVRALAKIEQRDPQVLYSWSALRPTDPEAAPWRAMGFTGSVDVLVHELDAEQVDAVMGPLYRRIRPRIPSDVRLVRLTDTTEAQRQQISALHVQHLGGRPREMRQRIGADDSAYNPVSPVLLRGEQVIGFSLNRLLPDNRTCVDANVIAPPYRGGWANIYLKHEENRACLAGGNRRGILQTLAHHTDTRRFVERCGGRLIDRLVSLYRPIDRFKTG
jgi:GNAT superfamily N-acetyltransferase